MNIKYTTLILNFFGVFCFAQVGIGTTEPKATLDIRAKDNVSGTKTLSINTQSNPSNSSNKELFTIYNDGRVNIGGLLKPNGNAGLASQVLVSNGSNRAPLWSTFNTDRLVINAFQIIFTSYDGQSFLSGNTVLVEYNLDEENGKSKIYSDPTLTIGVWEEPSYFKILQPGYYLVSWDVRLGFGEYPVNGSLPSNPISMLKYGANKSQLNSYIIESNTSNCYSKECDQFNVNNNSVKVSNIGGTVLLKLKANDYIAVETTAVQTSENINRAINILLSNITIQKIGL